MTVNDEDMMINDDNKVNHYIGRPLLFTWVRVCEGVFSLRCYLETSEVVRNQYYDLDHLVADAEHIEKRKVMSIGDDKDLN